MLTGLNHITLAVSDVSRSFDFYVNTLGFTPKAKWAHGAYLSLGGLWICLSVDTVVTQRDYTHYAFSLRYIGIFLLSIMEIDNKNTPFYGSNTYHYALYRSDTYHLFRIGFGQISVRIKSSASTSHPASHQIPAASLAFP